MEHTPKYLAIRTAVRFTAGFIAAGVPTTLVILADLLWQV